MDIFSLGAEHHLAFHSFYAAFSEGGMLRPRHSRGICGTFIESRLRLIAFINSFICLHNFPASFARIYFESQQSDGFVIAVVGSRAEQAVASLEFGENKGSHRCISLADFSSC